MTRALRATYPALWVATALGAALGAAGVHVITAGAPRDALAPTAATVVALLGHNALAVGWPLAPVWLGWPQRAGTRRVGDALIAGLIAGHGVVVGNVVAQHPETWRYLPHLPLEWLALALSAATWLAARRAPLARGEIAWAAACVSAVLALAAIAETYLVPLP